MKFFLKSFFFLTVTALLFSCTSREEQKGFIEYEMKSIVKSIGDTTGHGKGFAKLELVYPEIKKATNAGIADILNTYIINQTLTALFEEGRFKKPEYLIENFFKEYKKYFEELNDTSGSWSLERKLEIVFTSGRVVSFRFFEYSFLGGAHPNTNYYYTLYDIATGGKLTPKDIFIAGYETKLTALAEKKFREVRNLKPDESLSEAGFQFLNNKFTLNNNFGFTKEGIVFFYNAYEAGPYVLGSTEVLIPFKDVKELFVKTFLPPTQ
jgi:hypothetical protein